MDFYEYTQIPRTAMPAHYKKTANCKGGEFVLSVLSKSFASTAFFGFLRVYMQ